MRIRQWLFGVRYTGSGDAEAAISKVSTLVFEVNGTMEDIPGYPNAFWIDVPKEREDEVKNFSRKEGFSGPWVPGF
jgi:hypothetical protein